jgi:hypothetical protein
MTKATKGQGQSVLTCAEPQPKKFRVRDNPHHQHDDHRTPSHTMPTSTTISKKRKHASESQAVKKVSNKKSKALAPTTTTTTTQESILELEEAIIESPKHYNNIVTLLGYFKDDDDVQIRVTAGVSLCRTFCRLMAKGRLVKRKEDSEEEGLVVAWLKERYREFVGELCRCIDHEEAGVQVCFFFPPSRGNWGADLRRIRR